MKATLLHVLRALANSPEKIEISEIHGNETVFFEIRCHPEDVGTLIGKNGKTISAVRTLMNALSQRHHRQVVVEVLEP